MKSQEQPAKEFIEIITAPQHNLKNISLCIPRHELAVITGISGSGKSSLAFDTIYAEGQRRYLESFSAYARNFIGNLERPDVDKINGLSTVISIEQKTTTRNPRSTVGTVTEIYDFMRLLFARAGEAYSYLSGMKMQQQSEDQITAAIYEKHKGQKIALLAPLVRGRKGHYRELFMDIRRKGFGKVRVDGKLMELVPKIQVDRFKIHDIEAVIDRLTVDEKEQNRMAQSVQLSLKEGKGVMMLLEESGATQYFSKFLMDPETGISYDEPAPNMFSFNSPYGACQKCHGLGAVEEITEESVMPNMELSIREGGILPMGEYRDIAVFRQAEALLKSQNLSLATPLNKIPRKTLDILLYGDRYRGEAEGIISFLIRQIEEGGQQAPKWAEEYVAEKPCPHCKVARLKIESLHFYIDQKNIAELAAMDIDALAEWFSRLEDRLSGKQQIIAAEVLKEIRKRIRFLLDVGLDYLQLNRPLRTLSGGEAQRIRLATQIGTQLVGVLYILDEPSIGLHARDNVKLIKALKDLRDLGNSVIVVEHDKEMMLEADYIIDIGPGAGRHGGHVVAADIPSRFMENDCVTAHYLSGKKKIPFSKNRRSGSGEKIVIHNASGHNLKNITFEVPLGVFTCVTGVSGSGKSSLIHETLFPILNKHFYNSNKTPLPYARIDGLRQIDKVVEVDQSPIGRTPRSNPATYTGVLTDIRDLFSQLPEAKIRGYKTGRFSFNVTGGRCETCHGGGLRLIEMEFLPDVYVLCETCKGKRYNRETLEGRFKGKYIKDVVDMTVEEAVSFFENQPKIKRKIQTLFEVGLGYITLGQHATTLSGGEAQRVKLAAELSRRDTGKTLYILDEPTTGLHFQDIHHLLDVLQKLADKGNTVLVIEHNMDVIKAADHIIDLGPEGGGQGGQIEAQGTPEEVANSLAGYTGKFLREELKGA